VIGHKTRGDIYSIPHYTRTSSL